MFGGREERKKKKSETGRGARSYPALPGGGRGRKNLIEKRTKEDKNRLRL